MAHTSDEFERLAKAERWLCEEAAPVLGAIVRSIERRAGITIAEIRVTFSNPNDAESFFGTTCTIVQANLTSTVEVADIEGAVAPASSR